MLKIIAVYKILENVVIYEDENGTICVRSHFDDEAIEPADRAVIVDQIERDFTIKFENK